MLYGIPASFVRRKFATRASRRLSIVCKCGNEKGADGADWLTAMEEFQSTHAKEVEIHNHRVGIEAFAPIVFDD